MLGLLTPGATVTVVCEPGGTTVFNCTNVALNPVGNDPDTVYVSAVLPTLLTVSVNVVVALRSTVCDGGMRLMMWEAATKSAGSGMVSVICWPLLVVTVAATVVPRLICRTSPGARLATVPVSWKTFGGVSARI